MRNVYALFFFVLILTGSVLAQSATDTLRLSDLLQELQEENPRVKALLHQWKAQEAAVAPAGALPDPQIGINFLNLPVNSFAFDQEAMTGKQISFMQYFPFPGKLGLKENIARDDAQIAHEQYQEGLNQLRMLVKQTYYDIYYIDKAIEITQKNADILVQFIKIAETKYTVGRGLQQDVLRAQVEHSRMTDKIISLQNRREVLLARLNYLLSRPPASPVWQTARLTELPFPLKLEDLRELAVANRPLLKAWRFRVEKQQKAVRLAKKEYLPDFKVAVAYTQRDALRTGGKGVDFISGLFTIKVPLYFWKKQRKVVEQRQYQQISAQQEYENLRNQVLSEVESTWSTLEKSWQLIDLYRTGIIPQATQSLNSAIAGYQTDKVDFLTLLNNQITLYNYEMDYHRILSAYYKSIARMEYVVGQDILTY